MYLDLLDDDVVEVILCGSLYSSGGNVLQQKAEYTSKQSR